MAENKKFSVRTDGTGQNVFVSDVFLLSVPEEDRPKALSINDDGRVVLTTVSGSGGGGTVDTGSLLNNASVSLNTITFQRGDSTTFDIIVDTGSAATVNTGSLLTTASVSLNTITFTKGDASTFDITVNTGSSSTIDTGSLLNNASVSLNTLTFTRGDSTTFDITVDTGSATTVNTGSLLTTASVSLNTITFTKGDSSTFNIIVDTGSDAVTSYTNATNNRVITSTGAGGINGEANLTFDGSTLTVTGGITATIGTGTDNSVVVKNSSNQLVTDEIDPKVWAGNLVDKQGTPVQYQVAIFNDSDTLVGSSNFTFNGSTLSITGNVTATSFTGSLSGSATTSTTSTTADTASKITIDPVTSTDTTTYPVLVGNNSVGAQSPFIDNTNLSYNASTNTLTTTTFSGALSGNASTATTASYANKLNPNAWYKEVGNTITSNKDTTNAPPGFLYPMDSSTGTITFTLNAGGASLSGGEEWDFFVLDLTNQIDFTATGGESVISENGLKANSTGSAITAKFLGNIGGTNTWALVGSLQP